MKAKHCDECLNARWLVGNDEIELCCVEGHKPKFYKQQDPVSTDWGYKRRCADFEEAVNDNPQHENR